MPTPPTPAASRAADRAADSADTAAPALAPRPRSAAAQDRLLLRALGIPYFVLLIWGSAHVAIPTPPYGIPVTLQTLAIILAAMGLGRACGTIAVASYVLLGALGAPMFAEGASGFHVILGNTGGYLLGMILAAPVVQPILRRPDGSVRGWGALIAASLAAHAVVFAVGVPWLAVVLHIGIDTQPGIPWPEAWWNAFYHGLVTYLPGTFIKSAMAVVLGRLIVPFASRHVW
jgi:biotin transport system substrate-specific component